MFAQSRFILLLCTVPLFGATDSRFQQAHTLLGALPLRFEANQGQTAPSIRFIARSGSHRLLLTDRGASVVLGSHKVDLSLLHSNPAPLVEGLNPLPTHTD